MALTKYNPDGEFAQRWQALLNDIRGEGFSHDALKRVLTEQEYKLLVELAKKVNNQG